MGTDINTALVDIVDRARLLDEVDQIRDAAGAAALVETKNDGRIKLLVTSRALRYRRDNPKLCAQGGYTPITVEGNHAARVAGSGRTSLSLDLALAPGRAGAAFISASRTLSASWIAAIS